MARVWSPAGVLAFSGIFIAVQAWATWGSRAGRREEARPTEVGLGYHFHHFLHRSLSLPHTTTSTSTTTTTTTTTATTSTKTKTTANPKTKTTTPTTTTTMAAVEKGPTKGPERFADIPSAIDIGVGGVGSEEAVEVDLQGLPQDPTELCHLLANEGAARSDWLVVALAYAKGRQLDQAIEVITKALPTISPDATQDKLWMMSCLSWLHLQKAGEAPRVVPEGALASEVKTKDHYLKAATTVLNDASRLDASFHPIFLARGVLHLLRASLTPPSYSRIVYVQQQSERVKMFRLAIGYFDDALKASNRQNAFALLGKAKALYSIGQYSEALEAYQHVVSRNPGLIDPDPRVGVGCCLWHLGFKDEASQAWERALELNPYLAVAHVLIGLRQLDASSHLEQTSPVWLAGYRKTMTEHVQNGFRLDKNLPLAGANFAAYFFTRKAMSTVETLARKAIEFTDVSAIASDGWLLLARKAHADNLLARALELYKLADEARGGAEKGYPPAKLGIAQLLSLTGDKDGAKACLEQVIQLSKSLEAMTLLGNLYAEEVFAAQTGNPKDEKTEERTKAIRLLEAVLFAWKNPLTRLAPDTSVLLTLARLYEDDDKEKGLQCLAQYEDLESKASAAENDPAEEEAAQQEAARMEARMEAARMDVVRMEATRKEAATKMARITMAEKKSKRKDAQTARRENGAQENDVVEKNTAESEAAKNDAALKEAAESDEAKNDAAENDVLMTDVAENGMAKVDAAMKDAAQEIAAENDVAKNDVAENDVVEKDASKNDAAKTDVTETDVAKDDAALKVLAENGVAENGVAENDTANEIVAEADVAENAVVIDDVARKDVSENDVVMEDAVGGEAAIAEAEGKSYGDDRVDVVKTARRRQGPAKVLPPELFANQGCFHFAAERYGKASACFQKALDLCTKRAKKDGSADPDALATSIRYGLGRCLEGDGRFDESKKEFLSVLERRPDYPDARIRLAVIALQQHPTDEGPKAVSLLMQHHSSDLNVRALYGWYLGRLKKRPANLAEDPEQRLYKHTLQHFDKHDVYALTGMGNLWRLNGRNMRRDTDTDREKRGKLYEKAVEFYDKALQLDPRNAYAAQGIAIAMIEDQKDHKGASSVLAKVAQTVHTADTFNNLGYVYGELKQYPLAIEHFEMALAKRGGRDPLVLTHLGRVWYLRGKQEKSVTAMKRGLEYSQQALELGKDQIDNHYLKFNLAFVQFQMAQLVCTLPESRRVLADMEAIAVGLDAATESASAIAEDPTSPFPKNEMEARANMARNTLRKQLERAVQSQREHEEAHAERLRLARERRELELEAKREQVRQAELAAARERKRMAERQEIREEQDRLIAAERAEELRKEEEAMLTTDAETGQKVKRTKRRAGGKRKKKAVPAAEKAKSDTPKADGPTADAASSAKRLQATGEGVTPKTTRASKHPRSASHDRGDDSGPSSKKLQRKRVGKARSSYKSSELVVESDRESEDDRHAKHPTAVVRRPTSDSPASAEPADTTVTTGTGSKPSGPRVSKHRRTPSHDRGDDRGPSRKKPQRQRVGGSDRDGDEDRHAKDKTASVRRSSNSPASATGAASTPKAPRTSKHRRTPSHDRGADPGPSPKKRQRQRVGESANDRDGEDDRPARGKSAASREATTGDAPRVSPHRRSRSRERGDDPGPTRIKLPGKRVGRRDSDGDDEDDRPGRAKRAASRTAAARGRSASPAAAAAGRHRSERAAGPAKRAEPKRSRVINSHSPVADDTGEEEELLSHEKEFSKQALAAKAAAEELSKQALAATAAAEKAATEADDAPAAGVGESQRTSLSSEEILVHVLAAQEAVKKAAWEADLDQLIKDASREASREATATPAARHEAAVMPAASPEAADGAPEDDDR
ncbi:MAG: hypothetical protein M1826_007622 [Phylliscum demangeonii]|nr:MAG: hypothetical protein M1826_007622 [Phylliscum demangeonii]